MNRNFIKATIWLFISIAMLAIAVTVWTQIRQDEICVNADCPMCCDYCPVADYEGVCRYEERGEDDDGV